MNVELLFRIDKEWKLIELSEDINYTINRQFIDLNDLTSISTDYTKTIKIPFTPFNNEIFNYYYKIQSKVLGSVEYYTFDPTEKIECCIKYNNNILLEGDFILDDIDSSSKTYNGTIVSSVNKLYRDMLSKTIKDYEVIGGHNIMENIRVSPDIIKRSIEHTFQPNYSETSINNFEQIMGFAIQEIPKSDIMDTTKIQYSTTSSDPTTPPVDIDAYIKYLHSTYDTSFHKTLVGDGVSFPFKLELPVLTTKAYLYVKSLISMIKHKLSNDYNVKLDTTDIDGDVANNLCYFPSSTFNSKDFAKQDSSVLNIEKNNTTILSGMYPGLITGKNLKNANIPFTFSGSDSNTNITVQNSGSNYIKVTNRQSSMAKFDLILNQSLWYGGQNTRNVTPNADPNPVDMYLKHRISYPVVTVYYQSFTSAQSTDGNISAIHVYYGHNKIYKDFKKSVDTWIGYKKILAPNLEVFETRDNKGYDETFNLSANTLTLQSVQLNPVSITVQVPPYGDTYVQTKQFVFNQENYNPAAGRDITNTPTVLMPFGWYEKDWFGGRHLFHGGVNHLADISGTGTIIKQNYRQICLQVLTTKIESVNFKFNGPSSYTRKYNNLSGFFDEFVPFQWLFDFCKKNRYYIEYNQNEKTIKIYSKYFTVENGMTIVEKNIDYSKEVNIRPLNNEYKYIEFGYKENKNQNLNEYKKTYGVEFGDIKLNTLYKNSNDVLKLSTGNEICPVVTNRYGINFDTLKNWNPTTSIPTKTKRVNYFVIDDVDDKKYGNNNFYLYRGGYVSTVGYMITWPSTIELANNVFSYHDKVKTDSSEIAAQTSLRRFQYMATNNNGELVNIFFNKPMTIFTDEDLTGSEDLYTHRWKNYLDEIFDINNRKVTCYVSLSIAEYYSFRFNQLWNIEGNLFIVNKIIDFNPNSNAPTKVELIKVENINNYN